MKIIGRSSGKQVLGVMADGTDLRIAHMGWENGEIVIYSLESVTLSARLGRIRTANVAQAAVFGEDDGDIFGLEEKLEPEDVSSEVNTPWSEEEQEEQEGQEGQEVSGTLINIFSKYSLKKNKIAVNIPEGQATYYSFESDFGLKDKKLRKRLADEISPLAGGTLDSAIIDFFRTDSGSESSPDGKGLMVVVSEGNIPLVEELVDIKNFLAGGVPYFCQVSSNEIALVNLVRLSLDPTPGQIAAVVYIGYDFSRVIILRGSDPISFIQSIHEGYQSPQVCQTLFSKILLEQEESGIPEIDRIVLTGEIGMTHAFDYFSKQFPEADVQPITPGPLDTSLLKNEEIAIFPNFAIPVSMAWEALDKKNSKFIKMDLMPHSIKESQKVFKVAWHGFALLGIIFIFMALLSYQGINRWNTIRSLEESINLKQTSLEALQPDLNYISQLQKQININKSNLEFLESIIVDPDKWSRLFSKLSKDFQNVNRIWIDRIKSTPEGFNMVGRALARDRVPKLAAGFGGVSLRRVTRVISQDGSIAYEFEIDAAIPPPLEQDIFASEAISTDRALSTSGSIMAGHSTSGGSSRDYYKRGINLVREENAQSALGEFKALLEKYPQAREAAAAQYWVGECYYSLKDYNEAARAFEASLSYQKNSKRQAGIMMLGMTYMRLGQKDKARHQFEALLEAFPDGEYSDKARFWLNRLAG